MTVLGLKRILPYDEKYHQWPQIFAIFVVSGVAFTCGSLFAWPAPATPVLMSNSSRIATMTLEEVSYLTVIPPIAAILTAPMLGYLIDIIGRKKLLILLVIPQCVSWILISLANNVTVLYISRFLAGAGDGIVFTALTAYVAEISNPSVRGSWGNLPTINIYLGQCMVNLIGVYFSIPVTAIILACVPVLITILIFILPESPYYLVMKGRQKEAKAALQQLNWKENVDEDLILLNNDVQRQISETGSYMDFFRIPTNGKALLISIALRGFQQSSGLSAYAVYCQYIFNQVGSDISGSTSSIIYFTLLVVMTTIFALFTDKLGRKKSMIFSSLTCAIVLTIEGAYFYIDQETNIDTSDIRWIPLAGLLTYIIMLSAGLGLVPTLMLGELFSASIKSKALSITQMCFGIYVLAIPKLFQVLTSNTGMYLPFFLFAICCVASMIFSYFCVPETKGKTLEEIQQLLKGEKPINTKEKNVAI